MPDRRPTWVGKLTMAIETRRSAEIVARLILVGNAARKFIVIGTAILFGGLLAMTGRLLLGPSLGWIAGFIGAAFGYVMGGFLASLIETTLEWMAQMLILEDETK